MRLFANFSPLMAGQLALGASALLLVSLSPPAQGRMLLVPLTGAPIARPLVEGRQATILKPGPLAGSWVVDGQRSALTGLFSSNAIIVMAAPDAICGGPASEGDLLA